MSAVVCTPVKKRRSPIEQGGLEIFITLHLNHKDEWKTQKMKALCLEKLDGVYDDGESMPSSPDSPISSEGSVSDYEWPAMMKRRKQVSSNKQDSEVEVEDEDEVPAIKRRKDISSSDDSRTITCNKNIDELEEELKDNVGARPPSISSEKALSDNDETVIVVHEQREQFMFFSPVNSEWQISRCRIFALEPNRKHPNIFKVRVPYTQPPQLSVSVKGDGNCFFRAISFVVAGTEEQFAKIRVTVCAFLQRHNREFFEVTNDFDYVKKSKMDCDGQWASEVEIFAVATLLNTDVFVFSEIAPGEPPRWLRHKPLHTLGNAMTFPATFRAIYLSNLSCHFEPVMRLACS